jgi:hypothetical protein
MLAIIAILPMIGLEVTAQEVKSRNASSWELSGLIQMQHAYNKDIEGDAVLTNNGFRIRRGRLVAKGKVTDYVETTFQIEVRDNNPRLKDAEGKIKLAHSLYFRLGQFKVPVWREELRSSTDLLLIERSLAADFLILTNFSARQIGIELGRKPEKGVQFMVNLANGAGEGVREDAGTVKNRFVNNGKLYTGRLNLPIGERVEIGVSGAANRVSRVFAATQEIFTGTSALLAPDVGIYLKSGATGRFDLEGGAGFGKVSKSFDDSGTEDYHFKLLDITGRWLTGFNAAQASLGGVDAFELAGGVTFLEPNDTITDNETLAYRLGPAVYFGKRTRLQVNAEFLDTSTDSFIQIRTQANFIF